ncbi:hypothetical protein AURDEDRAFT_108354 [Auricularia subglabra TFB-10046 SS5]|uniref:DnaJ homologue subfamily C member 28 conserved domain-containing protein n=1 Tax=Auricularia subglabra (strain TFB-10046 / SS5) TaxID=717982 RepID=J0WV30_AURST|nr:hypothetical protein AURDEDRAFT_108354 [Auricularia subglabra TFB-10046 SS5]
MLVDKYKPLREGTIRSADEKLKGRPPQVASSHTADLASQPPALEDSEDIRPWMVTFKPPSFVASVRTGTIVSSKPGNGIPPSALDAPMPRQQLKRVQGAGRLTKAREASLDYRLRLPSDRDRPRVNPVTLKGWGSLVEERIERAKSEGQFKTLNGRGKPLQRETAEGNPFIGREEFLMNRIVQRQGAAPPWVEIQQELESAISSFRDVLQASWVRTAIRLLSVNRAQHELAAVPREEIAALRDAAWEARERPFHDAALDDVNRLVRKHNGVAPVPVRKGYHTRDVELARCYRVSVDAIAEELARRASGPLQQLDSPRADGRTKLGEGVDAGSDIPVVALLRQMLRRMLDRFVRPL